MKMFQRIHKIISGIPKGKVATYGSVAEAAGFPGAARQVVWALRAGPPGLPWHRVVGAGGRILLTGEHALDQRLLLDSEGVAFRNGRVSMAAHEHRFRKRAQSR